MASTDADGALLQVVGTTLANGLILAAGRDTLGTGTAEVVTGLAEVHFFVATQIGALTATEAVALQVDEDLPLGSGTVTVSGVTADVGGNSKAASSEQFNWIAIGRR